MIYERREPIELSETIRGMCEQYERNQEDRLRGRDDQSTGNPGFLRTGEALRQVVQRNREDFVGIARGLVDELAGSRFRTTLPQAYLTVHERAPDVWSGGGSTYRAQLWARRPVIDGRRGEPVSALEVRCSDPREFIGTIEGRHLYQDRLPIQLFDTRVTYLTLASNANGSGDRSGRQCCEEEQRELVALLNGRGVVVRQEEPTRISLGDYDMAVDFYGLHSTRPSVNMHEW